MAAGDVAVRLAGVSKDYLALRPLRVERLDIYEGDTVALLGLDRAGAEVLVNLITAATLPDAGEVSAFGTSTRAIADADSWFRSLDRFGILSERVVLLDELTVGQNLALPLSLDVADMTADLREQVERLAVEVGIPADDTRAPMGSAGAGTKLRVRLGKALALNPAMLLAEHPNAMLPPGDVAAFGRDLAAIAERRRLGMLIVTADERFAAASCRRVMTLRPATGELVSRSGWRRWLGGR